ncbi:MAG: Type 1 glutamine amidotransferase-like domain-containing protein [Candidatus Riflebacteria bacterium]|nr:Type 1 glutamine amidotransferase-like domain-containing protein [Candidatus Riflebacteria bacterium]
MRATELVYSSHDRCEVIHRDWIVQRILESEKKTVLYLPMSSVSKGDQEYSWGTFSWYFDRFRPMGLVPRHQLYDSEMSVADAKVLLEWLAQSDVVILGGGETKTGMLRYQAVAERATGNPGAFCQILKQRQANGLLTAGFSAGAVQLCQHSFDDAGAVFGLVRNVITTLHYEPAGAKFLQGIAQRYPDCLVFGLPNDSGIAVSQGTTKGGKVWQHIEFVADYSWDKPEDQWHIKTRQGVKVEHRYADGRSWSFNGGDVLVRVFDPKRGDSTYIKWPDGPVFCDRNTQGETPYRSVEEIIEKN